MVRAHITWPGVPMKLLKEVLRQEGEEGVFGRADSVAGVFPGDLCPIMVAHAVVRKHDPLLCQVVALPPFVSGQQWCGF